MDLRNIPEEVLKETPEYKCLQSQFLSAVQRVSKCENPAGWGQSSAAYSQKCSPAADRAHGGERDDGTEMIADSYIWVRFFSW